jgi:anti-sigma-K factor RskA
LSGNLSGLKLTTELGWPTLYLVIAVSDRTTKRRPAMLAQDRTAQLSTRTVLLALAAIAMVVLAVAAGIAIRWATTPSVTAPQAPTTVQSQLSTSGSDDHCVMAQNHHKGC